MNILKRYIEKIIKNELERLAKDIENTAKNLEMHEEAGKEVLEEIDDKIYYLTDETRTIQRDVEYIKRKSNNLEKDIENIDDDLENYKESTNYTLNILEKDIADIKKKLKSSNLFKKLFN